MPANQFVVPHVTTSSFDHSTCYVPSFCWHTYAPSSMLPRHIFVDMYLDAVPAHI